MANWYHYAAALALAASPSFGAIAQESSAPDTATTSEQVVLEADYVYELRDEKLDRS